LQALLARCDPLVRAVAAQVRAACPPSIAREDLEQIGRMALFRRFRDLPAEERNDSVAYVRGILRNAMWGAIRGPEFRWGVTARDAWPLPERGTADPIRDPFVREAAGRLPAIARRVLELRYRDDLDQGQVAARMGISRHSVRRAEASGIAELRRQFAA
jgi:RNA polymerase sigma factor (sigma-70 family)